MPAPSFQLRNTYNYLASPEAVTALLEIAHSFFGKGGDLYLQIDFPGIPERVVTYGHEQEFLQAASTPFRRLSINGSESARSLWISWDSAGSLDITAIATDETAAVKALADIEKRLNLGHASPRSNPRRFLTEGLYTFLSPPAVEWLPSILPDLRRLVGTPDYADGEFRRPSAPHLRYGVPDLDTWFKTITTEWGEIIEWTVAFSGPGSRYLKLTYVKPRYQLRVRVESPIEQDLIACFSELETKGNVVRTNDFVSPEQFRGRVGRFFLKHEPQASWVDRFLSLTVAVTGPRFGFNGKFRTLPPERLESTFGNLKEWRDRLEGRWPSLSSLSCWLSGPTGSINMDLDLRRDLLGINIQINANEDPAALFGQIQNSLDLSEAIDAPYKYRRFGRRYTIGHWTSNGKFADALKNAIGIAFQNRVPALERAYIARGGSQ